MKAVFIVGSSLNVLKIDSDTSARKILMVGADSPMLKDQQFRDLGFMFITCTCGFEVEFVPLTCAFPSKPLCKVTAIVIVGQLDRMPQNLLQGSQTVHNDIEQSALYTGEYGNISRFLNDHSSFGPNISHVIGANRQKSPHFVSLLNT